jgi:hypothetical protein
MGIGNGVSGIGNGVYGKSGIIFGIEMNSNREWCKWNWESRNREFGNGKWGIRYKKGHCCNQIQERSNSLLFARVMLVSLKYTKCNITIRKFFF